MMIAGIPAGLGCTSLNQLAGNRSSMTGHRWPVLGFTCDFFRDFNRDDHAKRAADWMARASCKRLQANRPKQGGCKPCGMEELPLESNCAHNTVAASAGNYEPRCQERTGFGNRVNTIANACGHVESDAQTSRSAFARLALSGPPSNAMILMPVFIRGFGPVGPKPREVTAN